MTSSNCYIVSTSLHASLLPACAALVANKGWPAGIERWEVESTGVLRGGGMALDVEQLEPDGTLLHGDIRAAFYGLVAQIEQLDAAKAAADEAARAAPPTKATLTERIAFRRWEEESKGVVVDFGNGRSLAVMTDATSQAKLTGLLVIASAQPIAVSWKGSDGTFLNITNADVPQMAGTVFAHVQACFARESQLVTELESVEDTAAFAEVVDLFWPE